jgi:hypothetical protein
MGISVNVRRDKLIAQLNLKLEEVKADYVAQREKLNADLASLNADKDAWIAYHNEVAAALTDGTARYTDSGKLSPATRGGVIPVRPNTKAPGWRNGGGTKEDILRALEFVEEGSYYWNNDVRPYQDATALLEMSDEDTVNVEDSGLSHLLTRQVGRNWNWNY